MEKQIFNINGQTVELSEQDYIFKIFFNELYRALAQHLRLYKDHLDHLDELGNNFIRKLKAGLTLTSSAPIEVIQDFGSTVEEVIDNYLSPWDLKDDDLVSSYRPFAELITDRLFEKEIGFVNHFRDLFKYNKNFSLSSCNVYNILETWIKNNLTRYYKQHEKSLKGLEEYIEKEFNEDNDFFLGEDIQEWMRNWNSLYEKKYYSWMEGNTLTKNVSEILKMLKEQADLIILLKDKNKRICWMERMEYDGIQFILKLIKRITESANIPLNKSYCDWDSFEKFDRIYKLQRGGKNVALTNEALLENLFRFPFLEKEYELILPYIGDSNLELERFTEYLGLDIKDIKRNRMDVYIGGKRNIDFNNEELVNKTYEEIYQYRKFLGYDKVSEFEEALDQKLKEFDVIRRTVNGKLYGTLEEADEVRSRSFEGKEYQTKEQAELVRREVENIRFTVSKRENASEKFAAYERVVNQKWQTEEAQEELAKLKRDLDEEYQTAKDHADELEERKKKLQKKCLGAEIIILGIALLTLVNEEYSMGIIIFPIIIALFVLGGDYKKVKESKRARQTYLEINQVLSQSQERRTGTKVCEECNSVITDNMRYCPVCGKNLQEK